MLRIEHFHEFLAGKLGLAVDGTRGRNVELRLGAVVLAGEDVVGGELDYFRVHAPGGSRQIARAKCVDPVGLQRMGLTVIRVRQAGTVDDYVRAVDPDGVIHGIGAGNVHIKIRVNDLVVQVILEQPEKSGTQTALTAGQPNGFVLHTLHS